MDKAKKTIVIGHKHPDTDSICSAICYARYKNLTAEGEFEPARAGELNLETRFVLDHFHVPVPRLVRNVKTQVKDVEYRPTAGVNRNISLKKAWHIMQENTVVTLPAINKDNELEGVITVGDITRSYMNVYDSSILSKAKTQYANIVETLEGTLLVGDEGAYFDRGKVLIAAANPDVMEDYIETGDLVILGNRYEAQLCAIEMEAACIIICDGAGASKSIQKIAQEHSCTVITTPYDTYTAARLINQSMPIGYFMKKDALVTFGINDYIDEIREVMASKRFRDFPILDEDDHYVGMISRRNLLGARGKNVIMVDHNERTQAVDGIENANILAIIDHHRLGTIQTLSPVLFRNQPVGCTATIIYQMYQEHQVEIDKTTAGLLLAALVSDTLLFRSPTVTDCDREAGEALAKLSGEDPKQLAMQMFSAASELADKTEEEILHMDYKKFTAGQYTFCVGQISSMNGEELEHLAKTMPAFLEKAREEEQIDMVYLMLTNILTESTTLLCAGQGAAQMAAEAFHTGQADVSQHIPGLMSRKKQLIPGLTAVMQE